MRSPGSASNHRMFLAPQTGLRHQARSLRVSRKARQSIGSQAISSTPQITNGAAQHGHCPGIRAFGQQQSPVRQRSKGTSSVTASPAAAQAPSRGNTPILNRKRATAAATTMTAERASK